MAEMTLDDMETARQERISNGLCTYECECDKCVELDLEISRIDLCDIADWELSFEVELTQLVLPSVLDQPVDHPVEHSWQHAQYR